jgi:hypothetical protein
MRTFRYILILFSVAVPPLASAQTMNFEQAAATLGASCGKDIDDNCRGVNLDPTRLKECFLRNEDSLSAKCRSDYPVAFKAIEQRITARGSLSKLCNFELNRFCADVRQDRAKSVQCLLDSTRKNTPNCNKAIDAAGYR